MRFQDFLLLSCTVALFGCAQATPEPGAPETDTLVLDDESADRIDQLRVRSDGMTIWAEPQVLSESTWLVQARSSYNLAAIDARVGDAEARGTLVSARKFEVRMDARQLEANLGGEPLIVHLETESGLDYHVMFGARARFEQSTGSSKLYPWRNIEPIAVGRDRVFRGRVTTDEPFEWVAGWNDDDSEPIPSQQDETHWLLDWYPGTLAWSAHPTEDALDIVGETLDGERFRRDAPIFVKLYQLGVTNADPAEAWPAPACEADVLRCLGERDVEADDLASCGSWAEVSVCFDEIPVDDTADWIEAFKGDLLSAIIAHYGQYEQDIVESGGNPRTEALRSVDSRLIEEVTDGDDVPSGHSLDTHRVFTHPDVTFPGSDQVWFGVYDRDTGDLVEVYLFN